MSQKKIARTKSRSLWKRGLLAGLFVLMATVMAMTIVIYLNLRTLPKVDAQYLKTYPTTTILDDQGHTIWQPTNKHVGIMKTSDIPPLYQKTLIAVEDNGFWKNQGYSAKGVANMLFSVVRAKVDPHYVARGGSTIEQQLIKNVYFNDGNGYSTMTRKIQELYLARQIDHNFTKKQILTYYVNHLNFAEGDNGISAVMMTYFGKTPQDYRKVTTANVAEQAYLAGLGQNPTTYDLYVHPRYAAMRTRTVLSVMRAHRYITKTQYHAALQYNLRRGLKPRFWQAKKQLRQNLKYKSYTDNVLNELINMGYNLSDASLTVHTFLNQQTYNQMTNLVRQKRYYQDGSKGKEQVGATIMDDHGIVRGMVGSRHASGEFNRAIQRTRSSGSSAKPFTAYGPLLQYLGNQYNTASVFSSANYRYPGTNNYMHNWGKLTYGNVTAQYALWQSLNTVVARIDDELLGSSRMKAFLHGVDLDNQAHYSAIDGIGLYISTLDAAAAWNTLNNGGVYTQPRFVDRITFTDGSVKVVKPVRYRAMNASTAWVLTQMLRGVISHNGTGAEAAMHRRASAGYAGKTGTVGLADGSKAPATYGEGGSDSWFNSITNGGYAVSLWFGYDHPNHNPQVADNFKGPAILTRDLQTKLNANRRTISNWTRPSHVRSLGGSGIRANYAITDSRDLSAANKTAHADAISPHYNAIGHVGKAAAEISIDQDWPDALPESERDFYQLYRRNHQLLAQDQVIDRSLYRTLKEGN